MLGDGTNQSQWALIFPTEVLIPVLFWNWGIIFLSIILEHVSALPSSNTNCNNLRIRTSLGNDIRIATRHGRLEHMDFNWWRGIIYRQYHC